MKYATLRILVFFSLFSLFLIGIYYYHNLSHSIIQKKMLDDYKWKIYDLNYKLLSYIYDEKINRFLPYMTNLINTDESILSVHIADQEKKIILSTDRNEIGQIYKKQMISPQELSEKNINLDVGYTTPVVYDRGKSLEVYHLIIETKSGYLNDVIFDDIETLLILFSLIIILLFMLVFIITHKLVLSPINQIIDYVEDRSISLGSFYVKDFDMLKNRIIYYIEEINQQNQHIQTILNSQTDIVIVTKETEIYSANLSFFHFYDEYKTIEEFKENYQSICELFEDNDDENFISSKDCKNGRWLYALTENSTFNYYVKICKNNRCLIFSIKANQMPDQAYYVVVLRDVTFLYTYKNNLERLVEEEVQKRLKEEKRYEFLFNSLDEGVCMHSFDNKGVPGQFLEINKKMTTLFGYTKNEFLKMRPEQLHTPQSVAEMVKFTNFIQANGYVDFETTLLTKNGDTIYCELHSSLLDYFGETIVCTSIKNITEKRRLEDEMSAKEQLLIQQSKLSTMGEMLGSISHQWKQPLNAMSLIIDFIEDSIQNRKEYEINDEEINKQFETIKNQLAFMAKTITDFKNFFKPTKTKISFSIEKMINEIYTMLEPQYRIQGMKLCISKEIDVQDTVIGFPNEFKQVVMNLMNNTKDVLEDRKKSNKYHSIVSGEIKINISNHKDMAIIDYCDNGGGIPEKIMKSMFQPYNTSKGEKGTGIGMYMSHQIISNMGGKMSVANIKNGVCFKIALPLDLKYSKTD